MRTKIGIIICGLENNKQYVTDTYVQVVKSLGGLPIIIPLVKSRSTIREYVSLCDGFLFCGGGDITPLLFGQEPITTKGTSDITLDLFQLRLMKEILETDKPILAICRGMQVLNVACGGTLYQDLYISELETLNHMQTSLDKKDVSHKVNFIPNTQIYCMLGPCAYTNSFHHQAVAKLGKGLVVTGTTSDKIIEAIEMPSHTFVLGVQWHPENMLDSSSNMKQIFHTFIHYSKTH